MQEPDNSFASAAVPDVQNKTTKPPGILPKNAQTWIVVGLAAVMFSVIAFSNAGAPKPKARDTASRRENSPTQTRIDEYRAMVDEEAKRLTAERQKAEQARVQAQAAVAAIPPNAQAQPGLMYGPPGTAAQPVQPGPPPPSPEELQRIALEAEKRKRDYSSLFSSNVSLSLRRDGQPARPDSERVAAEVPRSGEEVQPPPAVQTVVPEAKPANAVAATGGAFRLFEGTVIETVLTNRLDGSFSGPVNTMVTTAVYSHDHQRLLIPQGARVLGEVQRVTTFGQQRLAVTFHRLIMPNGYSVSLDKFHGLSQVGETGLRDQVDRHYLQTFGVSLAVGAIAGIAQAQSRYGFEVSGADAYRQGVASSLSQSSMRILDKYLNVLPTFTIREGHRIKVYLTNDLLLPDYDDRKVPTQRTGTP